MIKNKGFMLFPVLFLTVAVLLAGCEMHHPTFISPSRAQVDQGHVREDIAAISVDKDYARALGKRYARTGEGPVELTITYDQQSAHNTALRAGAEAGRIKKLLAENGVQNINVSVLPVYNSGEDSRALISFASYEARPPEDCGTLPGFEDREVEPSPDYKLGCTVETLYAKQIARPKDLLGRPQTEATSDGRRAGNVLESYHTGVPNESLDGESASGD